MTAVSAHVELLTAEVRTLVVGNRQVTQSIFRQLDIVSPPDVAPFGRVQVGKRHKYEDEVTVVGRDRETGALVTSLASEYEYPRLYAEWMDLPLIVLAGLR